MTLVDRVWGLLCGAFGGFLGGLGSSSKCRKENHGIEMVLLLLVPET